MEKVRIGIIRILSVVEDGMTYNDIYKHLKTDRNYMYKMIRLCCKLGYFKIKSDGYRKWVYDLSPILNCEFQSNLRKVLEDCRLSV
jgi:hypothetical protein